MKKSSIKSDKVKLQLLIFLLTGIIAFIASSYFELFEHIHSFIQKREGYNLDELLIVFSFWMLYLMILLFFRTKELYKRNVRISKLSNELNEQIKSRDSLQSVLAHDLKAPFNSLIGFSSLLIKKNDELDSNTRKEYLEMINKTSRSTYSLLENILNWSSLRSGKLIPQFTRLKLEELVNESILLLETVANQKKIEIVSEVDAKAFVVADENMIKTVIRNLLSNAIKFSKESSSIKITSQIDEKVVKLTVSDKGVGLSNQQIEEIQNNNFSSTRGTANESGTGLGLKVCKEFLSFNNGTLSIDSTEGAGSDISFTLPIA